MHTFICWTQPAALHGVDGSNKSGAAPLDQSRDELGAGKRDRDTAVYWVGTGSLQWVQEDGAQNTAPLVIACCELLGNWISVGSV